MRAAGVFGKRSMSCHLRRWSAQGAAEKKVNVLELYLQSQVAHIHGPLFPTVAHNRDKLAPGFGLLAFQL